MEKDLHISDRQYLIALTLFFFPYAIFEVSVHFECIWMPFDRSMHPAGTVQRIPEKAAPVGMAVIAHVPMGNYDGTSLQMLFRKGSS